MIKPDLSVDLSDAEELLKALSPRNVSKPIRHALNNTALAARDAVRKEMPNRFTIRRPWAVRGIGAEFAKSGNLEAAVFSRDAFMRDQEEGGVRSFGGKRMQVVPIGKMQERHDRGIIPKSLWPKAICRSKKAFAFHPRGDEDVLLIAKRTSKKRYPFEVFYALRSQVRIKKGLFAGDITRKTAHEAFGRYFLKELWRVSNSR